MPDLILASTSPYRRALLERLGLPFRAERPDCDEEALKRPGAPPRQMAEELALAKASSLRSRFPGSIIIGSDQVAALDGEILGKPGTAERACAQLARLAGRTHELVTAVAVLGPQRTWRHTDVTLLAMRPLAGDEIARYVEADRPLDCAGAFKLEQRGIALFERIESADHTAIVGLPLLALCAILREAGFAVP